MARITINEVQLNYQLLSPFSVEMREQEPCLVYLHGLMMDNLSSGYFTFAQTLSKAHTLLLYDLRGHGKSSIAPTGYGVSDHAQELLDLLSALQLKGPLHLIGSSFGAAIAMECARLFPKRVQSLALIDGHPHSHAFLQQLGADLTASPQEQRMLIIKHFQHWLSRDIPRKRDRLAQRAKTLIEETSLIADLSKSAQNSSESIGQTLPPTLALYGAESDALPLAQQILSTRPEVTWKLFPKRSHALLWEETEAINLALLQWIEQHILTHPA